jgi:hypothetical protein
MFVNLISFFTFHSAKEPAPAADATSPSKETEMNTLESELTPSDEIRGLDREESSAAGISDAFVTDGDGMQPYESVPATIFASLDGLPITLENNVDPASTSADFKDGSIAEISAPTAPEKTDSKHNTVFTSDPDDKNDPEDLSNKDDDSNEEQEEEADDNNEQSSEEGEDRKEQSDAVHDNSLSLSSDFAFSQMPSSQDTLLSSAQRRQGVCDVCMPVIIMMALVCWCPCLDESVQIARKTTINTEKNIGFVKIRNRLKG